MIKTLTTFSASPLAKFTGTDSKSILGGKVEQTKARIIKSLTQHPAYKNRAPLSAAAQRERDLDCLVGHVEAVAKRDYNKAGWDILVECHNAADIREAIGGARTLHGAERAVWVKLVRDQYQARREVQAERF